MVGKKLPFAGYSVVKDQTGNIVPRRTLGSGCFPPEPLWLTNSQGPVAPRRSFAIYKSAGLFVPAKAHRTRRKLGGEYRARTGDLLDANQALSQLS